MASGRLQNRAGKEVAEDAKRAVQRAFEHAGLKPSEVRMIMEQDQKARFILGGANPPSWAHRLPALSVEFSVTTSGLVTPVRVFCDASDDDPATSMGPGVLSIKDCICRLEDISEVLKGVWIERETLVARQKAGEHIRSFAGTFRWEWTTMGTALGGQE
jgi:hypothetical protein